MPLFLPKKIIIKALNLKTDSGDTAKKYSNNNNNKKQIKLKIPWIQYFSIIS